MHLTSRHFKDAVYAEFARIGKALASPRRLELLDLLCQGPRTIDDLSRQVGQSLASTSHHLQVLRRSRLVEAEKSGLYVTYRLTGSAVEGLFHSLRQMGESHIAEIDRVTRQFLAEREALEPVDQASLLERVRDGEVLLIDVRPEAEYRAGHIQGALCVPLAELERHLSDLPRDRDIVAYCRGRYCVMSLDAIDVLREHGFTAVRLDDGIVEWKARGWAIHSEASP